MSVNSISIQEKIEDMGYESIQQAIDNGEELEYV